MQNLPDSLPTGQDKTITIREDEVFTFDPSDFGFSDEDGSSFSLLTLKSLPSPGVLKLDGVEISGIDTTVLVADIGNLTYEPVANDDGQPYTSFDFTVQDSSGANSVVSNAIELEVEAVADTPGMIVNPFASGLEDAAIELVISTVLIDQDGSETLTVVISGHPVGATFNLGADLGTGSWGVEVGDLDNLTILPPPNNNDNFTLSIELTATEANGGDTAVTTTAMSVAVLAVNDAPSVQPDQSFSR